MNYKDAIKKKITGEDEALDRRYKLWDDIVNSFEQGGEPKIKNFLIDQSERIINKNFGVRS